MEHIGEGLLFFFIFLARSKNEGPFSSRKSSPQNGWTHYGSTRFAGRILAQKMVAVSWVRWWSVMVFDSGGLRPCWCWGQVKVDSFWLFTEVLVSSFVP